MVTFAGCTTAPDHDSSDKICCFQTCAAGMALLLCFMSDDVNTEPRNPKPSCKKLQIWRQHCMVQISVDSLARGMSCEGPVYSIRDSFRCQQPAFPLVCVEYSRFHVHRLFTIRQRTFHHLHSCSWVDAADMTGVYGIRQGQPLASCAD